MSAALTLTAWFGERDRVGDRFLADALAARFAAHALPASCLVRGVEGFGAAHRLQTDRLLTLSEQLPMAAVAVGAPARIEPLAAEIAALHGGGLVMLAPSRLIADAVASAEIAAAAGGDVKLTLWIGRRERAADGRPAYLAAVDALHAAGVEGASVLLGVDGTLRGARERGRVLSRNRTVPLMVVAIGDGARIATALPRLGALLTRPLATVEPVRVHKRDGRLLEPLPPAADGAWRQLTVVASERAQHDGEPLHALLVRRLLAEGAAGATVLRGLWGYHGDHPPHGDRLLALRRRVPLLSTVVDREDRCARWFALIDELTGATGLVTSEPARPVS